MLNSSKHSGHVRTTGFCIYRRVQLQRKKSAISLYLPKCSQCKIKTTQKTNRTAFESDVWDVKGIIQSAASDGYCTETCTWTGNSRPI